MSDDKSAPRKPIPFPVARTRPPGTPGGPRELGLSPLAQAAGEGASLNGHWCSRCQGIWYGLPLEAQCPVCGHRGP
jgi:hypothetical protein